MCAVKKKLCFFFFFLVALSTSPVSSGKVRDLLSTIGGDDEESKQPTLADGGRTVLLYDDEIR